MRNLDGCNTQKEEYFSLLLLALLLLIEFKFSPAGLFATVLAGYTTFRSMEFEELIFHV